MPLGIELQPRPHNRRRLGRPGAGGPPCRARQGRGPGGRPRGRDSESLTQAEIDTTERDQARTPTTEPGAWEPGPGPPDSVGGPDQCPGLSGGTEPPRRRAEETRREGGRDGDSEGPEGPVGERESLREKEP